MAEEMEYLTTIGTSPYGGGILGFRNSYFYTEDGNSKPNSWGSSEDDNQ